MAEHDPLPARRGPEFMGHVLLTPKTCGCSKFNDDGRCPVCDWGLGVCAKCGAGESELDGLCLSPVGQDPGAECCAECGESMAINAAGVSNHLTEDGDIDYDRDADHVALAESEGILA